MADWTSDTIPKNIMETLVVDDLAVNYEISAGTIQAKNAATAWVNFDGTTTPPTIRDSYNVKDVVRTATGVYDIYFEESMDNNRYTLSGIVNNVTTDGRVFMVSGDPQKLLNKFSVAMVYDNNLKVNKWGDIQIFGGKNS